MAGIYFDLSAMDEEQLQYLSLYSSLFCSLPTSGYSLVDLNNQLMRSAGMRCHILTSGDQLYFVLEMTMLNGDIENAYDIAYELLFETDFSDTEYLKALVQQNESDFETGVMDTPYSAAALRARAKVSEEYAALEYVSGLTYGEFLKEVESELEENPEQVVSRLNEMVTLLKNRQNVSSIFVGNEEGIRSYQAASEKFFGNIPYKERSAASRKFTIPEGNEAFRIGSDVNSNAIYAGLDSAGVSPDGALFVTQSIVQDKLLIPQLRYNKGAYSVYTGFEKYGILLSTGRDPQLKDTYDYYTQIGDELRNMELTDEELEGYIVSSFVSAAVRRGPLTDRYHFLSTRVCDGDDIRNSYECLEQMLDTTAMKVKAYASVYDVLGEDGIRISIGNKSAINANADLFDSVRTLIGGE
jgi:Zn-dependent M16 (insulinase) family peptidase